MEEQTLALEELFLLREFSKCLENRNGDNLHHCVAPSCACRRIIPLIVQALYELQRPNEVIPFITGFYGDDNIPLAVVSLCAYLLLSIKRELEARNLVLYYLDKYQQPSDPTTTDEELAGLLEFYFLQILLPSKDLEEALLFLRHPLLSAPQRVRFATLLEARIMQRKQEEEDEIRGKLAPPAAAATSNASAAPSSASAALPERPPPAPTVTKGMPLLPVTVDERSDATRVQSREEQQLLSLPGGAIVRRLQSLVLSDPQRFAYYVVAFCVILYLFRQARRTGLSGMWQSVKDAVADLLHMVSANPTHRALRH